MKRYIVWMVLYAAAQSTFAQTYHCQPTSKRHCDVVSCQAEGEGFQSSEVYLWEPKTRLLTACMGESCFAGYAQRLRKKPLKLWAVMRTTHPDRPVAAPAFDIFMDIDVDGLFRVLMGDAKDNTMVYGQCQINP